MRLDRGELGLACIWAARQHTWLVMQEEAELHAAHTLAQCSMHKSATDVHKTIYTNNSDSCNAIHCCACSALEMQLRCMQAAYHRGTILHQPSHPGS